MSAQQPIRNDSHDTVDEKFKAKHFESIEEARDSASEINDSTPRTYADIDEGFDPKVVLAIVRKIDLRVIPVLALMYCISLIDRTNLSMARAANDKAMNKELQLDVGNHYSLATMIFFIPYIILEIPSQIGLRYFGPKIWLSLSCFLWGVVMMCFGFLNSWQGLVGLRALLGAFESTLFPGAAYLIACWYPRKQMATRNTAFYFSSTAVGGLSSILAWGISQMHGTAGKSGWRWIFILEGLMTIMIGIIGFIFLQEFPDRAKFLTEEEKEIVRTRIERDRGDATHDPLTLAKMREYAMEPQPWIFGIMFMATTLSAYSMAYFLPTILQGMGFSNMLSQLLYAPPKIWAIFPGMFLAYWCDKTRQRAASVMFSATILVIGTIMFSQLKNNQKEARYAGTFLAYGGATMNVPLVLSWTQTSIRSQSKRAFTAALLVAWGGVGGILAGVLFMQEEAKQGYPTGIWSTVGLNSFVVVAAAGFKIWFARQNRRADAGEIILQDHPGFRYQA
ncbi:hypothetical protein CcaverHIS002_0309760 [Cutaneotrichosporon cavernicola]|uniref:Major facilitator superfamily (MFS) profile domain-containing protein n=1 Tax=Cutaneotrichosporon cavernicola TaxID=279322 RepID=A0AA48L276_9TREE|nr:uncharacterized protein CcaverHIS019_0309600 [Cutaneotrichosporon cavernicola]BEI83108.1 hypothetical protein CcaverHIS002_0309760 [Cutaneotrichosporon cavernicola]BEI90890.1 hypothetical protein CcaverHIS019_0309600 [Cutaneotrichosporon cavernicola]BEI98669.1 hypothetical protein CcaverHIS631_0309680 [Cutaneotrichosporon cavernicola]BEJ06439.1 hypothetical protein CcaverHIS641_0309610 [Cutaneotrichosporon cavernicola]